MSIRDDVKSVEYAHFSRTNVFIISRFQHYYRVTKSELRIRVEDFDFVLQHASQANAQELPQISKTTIN